jgi:DNA-binding response OmpR family regulator
MESNKTILVIDDDLDFQLMIGNLLRNSGFSVRTLLEGKVDLTLDTARECDMVLLDVQLPGVSGIDLGKELKSSSETSNIPVILITGLSEPEKLFTEAQANALLKKPFALSGLVDKINELLPGSTDQSSRNTA